MAYDALGALQTQVTKTTAFGGTGYDLKTGTPRRGLKARFIISNYSGAGAGGVWTPGIEDSDDNTTFTLLSQGTPLTIGTAAGSGVVFVPFETSRRYVRAAVALPVGTSTPTISYKADIGLSRP